MSARQRISSHPLVARAASVVLFRHVGGSSGYWKRRYDRGGDSGVGSYGELALFKARELNRFVEDQNVASVVELGCGDGHQLSLARYPRYLGLDVAPGAVAQCRRLFGDDSTKSFWLHDTMHFSDPAGFVRAELSLSLDVLFHLVEDDVFDTYLDQLFGLATRFVAIYSSDKSITDTAAHVRHRNFTDTVARRYPDWVLDRRVENPFRGELEGAVADLYVYRRVLPDGAPSRVGIS